MRGLLAAIPFVFPVFVARKTPSAPSKTPAPGSRQK